MSAPVRRTSLHDRHAALGARLGAFAGWDMPLTYTTARAEHLAVRGDAGVFDVSHMGQIEVGGSGARQHVQAALTNDVGRIGPGQGQYTLICDDDGGVIDDLIVYALPDRYLIVANASNVEPVLARLAERAPAGVTVADRSPEIAMIALQGPSWREVLEPLAGSPAIFELEYFEIAEDTVAGAPALVAKTGYTGEPGVEILCPWEAAPGVWDALTAGDHPATPAGLVARDTLRLEMGYPLYGNELSRERTPIEAGLGWACDLTGSDDYAGSEVIRAQAAEGTPEKLCIFTLTEPGIPRAGNAVLVEGHPPGIVTSGTLSPSLEVGIGMAYVARDLAAPDTELTIDIRGKTKSARTARRPLVGASPKG